MHEIVVTCPDESDTMKVAAKIAERLKSGDVIELAGDIGSGKTTFVRGLAKGLGTADKVTSPSFALKNVYEGRLRLYHFDLYRLDAPGLIKHEIEESLNEENAAIVIEWADMTADWLPERRVRINFTISDKAARKLKIYYPPEEKDQ